MSAPWAMPPAVDAARGAFRQARRAGGGAPAQRAANLAPPRQVGSDDLRSARSGGATGLLPHPVFGRLEQVAQNDERPCKAGPFGSSGGRIRTCDLRVMSPTSYQTAPPRGGRRSIAGVNGCGWVCRVGYRRVLRRQVMASQRPGWGFARAGRRGRRRPPRVGRSVDRPGRRVGHDRRVLEDGDQAVHDGVEAGAADGAAFAVARDAVVGGDDLRRLGVPGAGGGHEHRRGEA